MSNPITEREGVEALRVELDNRPCLPFASWCTHKKATSSQGVYLIRDEDGAVLHVGRTVSGKNGLTQRLGNHYNGRSTFVKKYLNGDVKRLRNNFQYQLIEVHDDRIRALLEYQAIAWYCPAHLGLGRKDSKLMPNSEIESEMKNR